MSKPAFVAINAVAKPGFAPFATCFNLHPMGEPMALFNSHRFTADADPPLLGTLDAVPGPIPAARLVQGSAAVPPRRLSVHVTTYDETIAPKRPAEPGSNDVGLVLHLPKKFAGITWKIRGANLRAWEKGLRPPAGINEIVIDPDRGRLLFGVDGPTANDYAEPLHERFLVSASYGFTGPTGGASGQPPVDRGIVAGTAGDHPQGQLPRRSRRPAQGAQPACRS